MKLLYGYLRNYRGLIALALVLATINQVFSLLDPLIFRHVIDEYATRFQEYSTGEFFKGVSLLLARGGRRRVRLARGQELPGLLHQRHHAAARRAAVLGRHPALARAAVFGVRGPAQRRNARPAAEGAHRRREADRDLDQRAVHLAGRHRLRDDLRLQRALDDRAGLLPDGADPRRAQLGAEPADQADPEGDRRRDHGAGRIDDRVAAQHRAGEEPRPRAAGDRPAERARPARS